MACCVSTGASRSTRSPATTMRRPARPPAAWASPQTGGSASSSIHWLNTPKRRGWTFSQALPDRRNLGTLHLQCGLCFVCFLMMSDRNDLPYPVGRQEFGGGSPAGAVTSDTWQWWKKQVEAGQDEIIISSLSSPYVEGDDRGFGRLRGGFAISNMAVTGTAYTDHGVDGVPEWASYLYFVDESRRRKSLSATWGRPGGAFDIWLGGHTNRTT